MSDAEGRPQEMHLAHDVHRRSAMKANEFYAQVRDRGEYETAGEAERVTTTVLGLLGERLAGGEGKDLAAQLPAELKPPLQGAESSGHGFGVEEFLSRAAQALGATEETARWDVSAVLSTVADAVSGGEVNQILTQLQPAYALLFGRPDLA
jgi:uncharacterized protein (DUF2267 family)